MTSKADWDCAMKMLREWKQSGGTYKVEKVPATHPDMIGHNAKAVKVTISHSRFPKKVPAVGAFPSDPEATYGVLLLSGVLACFDYVNQQKWRIPVPAHLGG